MELIDLRGDHIVVMDEVAELGERALFADQLLRGVVQAVSRI